MRARYRFHACPTNGCPKLGGAGARCPEHDVEMVEVILRRETEEQRAEETAEKLRAAAAKVGAAAGKPDPDPFGIGDMLHGIADDISAGRPAPPRDDDEEEDDDDEDDF
jgi:hypothetical protein